MSNTLPGPSVNSDILGVWQIGENYSVYDVNEDASSSVVDGKYILARVVAESFFLEGISRNRRKYPTAAWNRALKDPEFIRRLNRRLVFGTFGHDQVLDDAAIREGKFSHIVSRVWITEDGKGMAEFLILNTPPGERLNTIFRAGSRPYVSTRASGDFLKARDSQGNQIVDPDTFALKTIDFVLDPGFLDADPELVENHNVKGTDNMNTEEKIQTLEEAVRTNQSTINGLTEENLAQRKTIASMEEELAAYRKFGAPEVLESRLTSGIEESLKSVIGEHTTENLRSIMDEHNSYKVLGSVAEVTESVKTMKSVLEEIGTPEEIRAHLTEHLNLVSALNASPVQIREMVESLNSLVEAHGDVAQIEETLNRTKEFVESCGSLDECETVLRSSLEFFESVGTADNIRMALTRVLEMCDSEKEQKFEESVSALAKELGQEETVIREALTKGVSEETLRSLAESRAPASGAGRISGRLFEDKDQGKGKKDELPRKRTLAESLIS